MATPKTVAAEYQRAVAAEGALGDRITKEVNARVVGDTALADRVTTLEEQVKALIAAAGGSGGGTTPGTPNTPPAGDVTAPVISNVVVGPPSTMTCVVTCTTDEAATVVVEYGTTTAYGSQTAATASGTSHSRTLSGLLPNQLYYVRIRATDTAGNLRLDQGRQFTTAQTTPVPSPTRPFAPPATTATINVSAGANLQSVVDAASDGTKFVLAAGATFDVGDGLALTNRHNLDFYGSSGTTIRATSYTGGTIRGAVKLDNLNTDIALHDITLQGSNPNTGTNIFDAAKEAQMGLCVFDGKRIELDRVRIRNVYGDFVYVAGKESVTQRPSEDVWVHDSQMDYCGRMGVVPKAVTGFIFERNTLDHIGLIVLDIECDYAFEVVDGVYFRDNTIGTYSLSGYQTNWFFACAERISTPGAGGNLAAIGDIQIDRNVVTGGALVNANNPAGKPGLASIADKLNRIQGLRFRDNSTVKSGSGPALYFSHIDGLTVTGNTQPLDSGALGSYSDNTSATTSPNP